MTDLSFFQPKREILTISDIKKWHDSIAYKKYLDFLNKINQSIRGVLLTDNIYIGEMSSLICDFISKLNELVDLHKPVNEINDRYGSSFYKKWYNQMSSETEKFVTKILPDNLKNASIELICYLLGSFGNSVRIDYGTGHEASFLIFLFCLYELKLFVSPSDDQAIALRIFHKYLKLIRRLQVSFRMEPAGSHGVHSLDDFQFLPFLFGSSQYINNSDNLAPECYLNKEIVEKKQNQTLFFEAIQYINETKKGPFHEHSYQLYNISGVKTWEKVNQGMLKMYEVEVLNKFPVVQHFLFGSLFSIKAQSNLNENFYSPLEQLSRNLHPNNLRPLNK